MKRSVFPVLLLSLLVSVMTGCGGNRNAADEVTSGIPVRTFSPYLIISVWIVRRI